MRHWFRETGKRNLNRPICAFAKWRRKTASLWRNEIQFVSESKQRVTFCVFRATLLSGVSPNQIDSEWGKQNWTLFSCESGISWKRPALRFFLKYYLFRCYKMYGRLSYSLEQWELPVFEFAGSLDCSLHGNSCQNIFSKNTNYAEAACQFGSIKNETVATLKSQLCWSSSPLPSHIQSNIWLRNESIDWYFIHSQLHLRST